jgi:hypothetical protein
MKAEMIEDVMMGSDKQALQEEALMSADTLSAMLPQLLDAGRVHSYSSEGIQQSEYTQTQAMQQQRSLWRAHSIISWTK